MADDAPFVPPVQHVTRRFHGQADLRVGPQIERDLVRRASAGQRASTAYCGLDVAMQMATEDQFDLRVARDDCSEGLAPGQPDGIHVSDPGQEGRMMHEQQRRAPALPRQGFFQPSRRSVHSSPPPSIGTSVSSPTMRKG